MKHVNVSVKVIVHVKKVIVVVLECEDSKYLKSIVDTSVIEFDGVITVMDIVSTKVANHIAINITSIASINFHNKKERNFAYSFISDPITIDNYYYLLLLCSEERY